jgi:eukaryotic-like serine/threonine-protein kinase
MALALGTKLGPYEILSFIGAGGMGEVYKARDSRLGRDVAVKVLPPSFAADAERLRRFEQEARAVAALNHPNIVAIHDMGQHDGAPFLVSELLEGESLREVLARGPLSHRRAIEYATQVAHGLAAAHGKNIAHRDLKPDNIFVTREGRVKILDFGLAKIVERPLSHADGGATMTAVAPATDIGVVMGTAGYMSPEQVRGGTVDCRTDIFSFGAVLFEMLTGHRAFKRDTAADTMAAILNDEPPELSESGRQIPPVLDRIVNHCLEKAPEQRFQSARDLAFDLESLSTLTGSGGTVAAIKIKQRRRWWSIAAAVAALVLIAAATGWKMSSAMRPIVGSKFHQVTYRRGTLDNSRFTPDGQNIIYTATWEGGEPELHTVGVNDVGGHPLGIHNARLLAISKRGELAVALAPKRFSVLLYPGTLARTTDVSATPRPEIENVQAADFNPRNSELAIVRFVPEKLACQLEYPIGKVLHTNGEIDDLRFSPDGRYLAFITHVDTGDDRGKAIIVRSTGEKVAESPFYESVQGLSWTPSGDEVWITSPLESGDVHALSLSGKVRVPLAVPGRLRLQDISADGRLLADQGIVRRGMIVARTGVPWQRDLSWLDFGFLRDISTDGKTILFEEEGSEAKNYTVFVRNVDGSPATPLGEGYAMAFSRDKQWVLALKLAEPNHEFWLYPVGPGEARRLSPANLSGTNFGMFLSDGKRVVYTAHEPGRPFRAWIQDVSNGVPRALTPEGIVGGYVSPDDKWVLCTDWNNHLVMVSLQHGGSEPLKGINKEDAVLGWSADNQIYVGSPLPGNRTAGRVDKLDPHSGKRTLWRELDMPPIGGVVPEPPIITPDGTVYGFDYRLRLSDLYTISGVR